MKVYPIRRPLPGEQVLGVDPPLAPEVDSGWRRRLNLIAGRALDADALTAEQDGRAGRLATEGQALSPGVVLGLDVALETDSTDGPFLRIRAGAGLMHTGEDVVVPTDLRVALKGLLVFWPFPEAVPPPPGDEDEEGGEEDESGAALVDTAHEPAPQRFEDWATEDADRPRAGIIVLQPVEVQLLPVAQGAEDPATDPCEEDPSAFAFENWERRDACRPVLYPWPTHWRPLPARDARWRNALAYTVFREEGRKGPEAAFPWEVVGVPIALIAFDETWAPLFVDRSSVVRAGGKPKRRATLVPGTGSPFLWQARFDQLVEELAAVDAQNAPIADAVARFRYMPPSGLLPRSACDPELAQQWFFPPSYVIDAAPVPIEHLDVALEASASLGRYDLFTPDQVRLLVPVPQRVWEPRLLHGEDVDPLFQKAIDEAVTRRRDSLMRRDDVREKAAALLQALTGLRPAYPSGERDPGRLDADEESAVYPIPISGRAHLSVGGSGSHQHGFTGAAAPLEFQQDDRLVVWVFVDPESPPRELLVTWTGNARQFHACWGERLAELPAEATVSTVGPVPPAGRWVRLEVDASAAGTDLAPTGMKFLTYDGHAAWGRAGVSSFAEPSPASEVVWVGNDLPDAQAHVIPPVPNDPLQEEWEWISAETPASSVREVSYGTVTAGTPPIRLVDSVERFVSEDVRAGPEQLRRIYSHGLGQFIDDLNALVDEANDKINFGYLRVQTAMYRLRQSVLGDKVGDRLITSPVLAAIAKESAGAVQVTKNLTELYKSMTQQKVETRWWGQALETPTPTKSARGRGGPATRGGRDYAIAGAFVLPTPKPTSVYELYRPPSAPTAYTYYQPPTYQPPTYQPPPMPPPTPPAPPAAAPPGAGDVEGARPVTEKAIRTTSIAERIEDSRAAEAKDFCAATKRDVIKDLLALAMDVSDLPVPGMPMTEDSDEYEGISGGIGVPEEGKPPPTYVTVTALGKQEVMYGTGMPVREKVSRALSEFLEDPTLFNWITAEHDPLPPADHEASYFAIGSDLLNHTIAVLRSAEGRVADYRAVVDRAQQALGLVERGAVASDRRLKEIEDQLTEARNDVATARALLADEVQRVRAINDRRTAILREHVTFLAYHRPRLTDPLVDAPVRALDPGPTESPVPECLSHEEPVPEDVQDYIDLLRDAPVSWFAHVPSLFDRFDRLPMMHGVMSLARTRSQVDSVAVREPLMRGPTILGKALDSTRRAQAEVMLGVRQQRQAVDLSPLAAQSWATLRTLAPAIVGLGDLMDAAHGRSDVAHLATQELDRIARVAGCLYRHFSQALPILRLQWAEQFSQYDAAANLRSLAVLPHWGQVDVLERREMQTLVDWLFLRINGAQAEAVSLMNDLVRTCLLVASHSPVNQILSGHVQQDTPVRPGGQVKVVSPAGVRVGMHVLLYKGADVVARGVVEDLSAGVAAARIIHAEKNETLAQGARVQFTQAPAAPTPKVVVAAMMARGKA